MANLLTAASSDFEDGTVGEWGTFDPANPISNSTVESHAGTHSLKFEITSYAAGILAVLTAQGLSGIAVEESTEYEFNAWSFAPTGSTLAQVYLIALWTDAAGNAVAGPSDVYAGPTEVAETWVQAANTFTTPVSAAFACMAVAWLLPSLAAGEHRYLDDCAVNGGDPVIPPVVYLGPNLLDADSSGFEGGVVGKWATPFPNESLAVTTDEARSGTHSLEVNVNYNAPGEVVNSYYLGFPFEIDKCVVLEPGVSYAIGGWLKAPADAGLQNVAMGVQMFDIDMNVLTFFVNTFQYEVAGEWLDLGFTLETVASTHYAIMAVEMPPGPDMAYGELRWLDDFSIREILDAPVSGNWSVG